ncbi:RNA polymerase sigma factor [Chryseobacterium polytrichastri]|uniref:RNA polymerase sigma factor n=1 Tax=Chryseobacterium polytrichastri TaxID=1302687 RepID=A0A1M7HDQ5_9FLAO|nr:sigma-70 family RNA polymerase sigma factor [Chryseobacterium polytrichastri]SHM26483.1 RNA polymerase sigma factor, sigma-70 family [Chryseobacterium polytrichastri]
MHSSTNWQKIYKDNSPKLLGICRRYIQDIYAAEDIIQDSFIAAMQNKHQLRDEKLLFAWLKKIVVNNALQYIRKNSNEIFTSTEISEIPDILSEMSDPVSEEKHIFIYDFTREELLLSIDSLPSHHKSVFNLYYIENYSHAEISTMLGINVNTSKSHLLRAKKSIQNYLLSHVDQDSPKNKKKMVQLLVFFGFGGLLWAQTFKSKFSDFNITPTKTFEIPENENINVISFPSVSNQAWKKKVIVSSTIILIIIASIFIIKPTKNYFTQKNPEIKNNLNTKNVNNTSENSSQNNKPTENLVPNSRKGNVYQTNSEIKISEAEFTSKEINTEVQAKSKKIIQKDSTVEVPKKVIVVKKIIQRDTIFVER